MLNKTKEKVRNIVLRELNKADICELGNNYNIKFFTGWEDHYFIRRNNFKELYDNFYELERKYNLLLKHLGLEYYKKEIKETNGCEKNYVKEGFRKVVK
jgi:hypothetical protein